MGSRGPFVFSQEPVERQTRSLKLIVRSGPAGGECGAGRGVSGCSGQGHPAPGTPSPTPSPSSCAGASPTENVGQRKRRQTPRLKNPDKRRGPPAPAARPRGAWHRRPGRCPLPWQPRMRPDPLPAFPLPAPLPGALLAPAPSPGPPPAQVPCSRARGARGVRPRRCPPSGGAATPALRRQLPGSAWIRPPPLAQRPHLRGPGLRAGRDPDQAEGDSIHRAAAAALRPGHCWGRGPGPGRGGAGGGGAERGVSPPPGASPFAPPPALPTGRTRRLSPEQLTDKGGSGGALRRRRS